MIENSSFIFRNSIPIYISIVNNNQATGYKCLKIYLNNKQTNQTKITKIKSRFAME